MSFNTTLVQHASERLILPAVRDNETFILYRPKVSVKLSVEDKTFTGTGHIIMTSKRLVFIKRLDKNFSQKFSSISIPFLLMSNPYFNQPFIKMNNFEIKVIPDTADAHPIDSNGIFVIYFIKGGASLFLKHFYIHYARNKNNPIMLNNDKINTATNEEYALLDPNDPTKVFLTQPETVPFDITDQREALLREEEQDRHTPLYLSGVDFFRLICSFFRALRRF